MKIFSTACDTTFPEIEIKIKTKTLSNPWPTKGIKKSSIKKRKLYEKSSERNTKANEETY